MGSFNNYVDKRGGGVSGKSTVGHVTKSRLLVCKVFIFCTLEEDGMSKNLLKFGPRSC